MLRRRCLQSTWARQRLQRQWLQRLRRLHRLLWLPLRQLLHWLRLPLRHLHKLRLHPRDCHLRCRLSLRRLCLPPPANHATHGKAAKHERNDDSNGDANAGATGGRRRGARIVV